MEERELRIIKMQCYSKCKSMCPVRPDTAKTLE